MVVKSVLVALLLLSGLLAFAGPTALACHETAVGCLATCEQATQGASSVEADCVDTDHALGTVQGVVVYGKTLIGRPPAEEALMQMSGDDREGYVTFWFEWDDAVQLRPDVQIDVEVDGDVEFTEGDGENLTFTANSTRMTVTLPFTVADGGHRHIPFTVRGNTAGQSEDTVEGVFSVPAGKDHDGGFWSDDVAGRYWYWLLLLMLVAFVLGVVIRRMLTPQGVPRHLPPLAA
jgi:hypothetical protein